MLGILYLVIAGFLGYNLLEIVLPSLFCVSERKSLFNKNLKLDNWMVTIPASFLTGILLIAWLTYFAAYMFKDTKSPMLFSNLAIMTPACVITILIIILKRNRYAAFLKNLRTLNRTKIAGFIKNHLIEFLLIAVVVVFSSFLMFYTFNIKDGTMRVGISVFSDFGPHLAVIRSFSLGSNFPTQYPHFADGNIRYHFMFQFLAGNLEYLGLRLDWAFNLPTILSFVCLFMLLYSLAVIIMGEKWTGIISSLLFFFRSSFAFVTYLWDLKKNGKALSEIFRNDGFIGKTLHEDWGLWNQNVYANQRHLVFTLAVLMLVLIIIFPLFKRMLDSFTIQPVFRSCFKEFILRKDAWLPYDLKGSLAAGFILGLIGYWNGAVLITALSVLFFFAILSKHRLEYICIAAVSIILFTAEMRFFTGPVSLISQSNVISIGFLSNIPPDLMNKANSFISGHHYLSLIDLLPKMLPYIFDYYIELLGVLPFIIIISLFPFSKRAGWISFILASAVIVLGIINYTPTIEGYYKYFIMAVLLITAFATAFMLKRPVFPKGTRWMVLAFLAPFMVANAIKLTPDIAINHKFIMVSAILLNIVAANLIYRLFKSNGTFILAFILLVTFTANGFIDFITIMNKDDNTRSLVVRTDDPITIWVEGNTDPHALFLTDWYVIHPILLAGRNIFYGWPYFSWSAGYDAASREVTVNEIYGGSDPEHVKDLVKKYGINYIAIDQGNRSSQNYKLNEDLIRNIFKEVYSNPASGIMIYKTN